MVEVVAIRELTDAEALDWLRSQEGRRTNLRPAELARRWGWSRQRVGRRIDGWTKEGIVTLSGRTITVADSALSGPDKTADKLPDSKPDTKDQAIVRIVENQKLSGPDSRTNELSAKPFVTSDTARFVRQTGRSNRPLVAIAYGFFGLGVGINIWNAWTGGSLTDMALPAALGVLAEGVVFFLPAWALTLPVGRQVLAWALFVFVSVFALTNSLRMASIIAADQATARADRQTEGVQTADRALEAARTRRDEACGRGLGKTVACQSRQAEVAKLEAKQTQAVVKVTAQAKPESGDFAKLVAWVSRSAVQPGANDFEMLWLLFRTFLPQVGGLVLMLAQRST